MLISCGERKVKIIQQVRKITGFDLSKAKKIADNLSYVKTNCSVEEANQIKILLENEGSSVDIVPYDPSQEKSLKLNIFLKVLKFPNAPNVIQLR
ncbi:ribosomal protein L7/L12 [Sporofaciens musculi]|uniref:ribosomal protein L7/L12 n=1 Tax=Sporofaciens musculi TaxID=2681861 RepID=UPI003FA70EAE